MSNYAEIRNGKVAQVLVVDGTEEEAIAWLHENVSKNQWVRTDENGGIRNKYAGIGDEYHPDVDKFISKPPFSSWRIDKERGMYLPPIPKPLAVPIGHAYYWSEKAVNWILKRIEDI